MKIVNNTALIMYETSVLQFLCESIFDTHEFWQNKVFSNTVWKYAIRTNNLSFDERLWVTDYLNVRGLWATHNKYPTLINIS